MNVAITTDLSKRFGIWLEIPQAIFLYTKDMASVNFSKVFKTPATQVTQQWLITQKKQIFPSKLLCEYIFTSKQSEHHKTLYLH